MASTSPSLIAITMLARSGATALAWARFESGGFAPDDSAALAVRGRLLKDRARAAEGAVARALYAEAAVAYARAAALDGTTYPLINAATLSLLGGDPTGAARLAADVLARLDKGPPDQETPYFRAATRAEALLLLGRQIDARAALADAIAVAPQAREDHATTLRQFALIHAETGNDASWLDALRPPRILHFAGRIAAPLAPAADTELHAEIDAILAATQTGTAFGAIAAGADLMIAEVLIARGAELHIVLPAPIMAFAATSVAPFGAAWQSRFDAVIAAAASIDEGTSARVDPLTIALASERAMGRTIQTADRLATTAVQLVINGTHDRSDSNTARDAALWRRTGRPWHSLGWTAPLPAFVPACAPRRDRLVALIELGLDDAAGADVLSTIHAAIAFVPPPLAATTTATGIRFAWPDPATAARAATAVLTALGPAFAPRVTGHYAIIDTDPDPFTGKLALFGQEVARTARLAAITPAGASYVSEDFLVGLLVRGSDFRHEYVGEAAGERGGGDLPLYAISRIRFR